MATVIPIDSIRKSTGTGFDRLLAAYRDEFQPKGLQETVLVEQLAHYQWRIDRIRRLRTALLAEMGGPEPPDDSPDGAMATLPKAA